MAARKKNLQLLLSLRQRRCLQTSSSSAAASTLSPLTASSPLPQTTTNANSSSSSSFSVHFLMNSCGLSSKSALSVSHKFQLNQNKLQNLQSVLLFLKCHEFEDTHIAQLIERRPQILHSGVEDTLKPKFDFFVKNGFTGKLLPQLIASDPTILSAALDSHIKPCFELLKSFLGSTDKIVVALRRAPFFLSFSFKSAVRPNIELLIKEGMPVDRVAKLIILYPRSLLHKLDRVVYAVNTVKTLGLEPGDNMFVYALAARIQMRDATWKKKIEVMKSLGWSEKKILATFKRYPQILAYSEKKIRSTMDFFINTVELERQILFAYPSLLCLSLDKRIRPRYNVILVLKSKNLINGDNKIPTMLILSDKKFLENYVIKYADDVPGLLEVYMGTANTKEQDA